MTPLRAALLLLFLPALATAAPAPLPRQKKDADARGWSAAVEGLRIRLVAPHPRCRAGEAVRLVLEIQNVGGSTLTLEAPHLSSYVDAPGHASPGWALTGEKID